MSVWNLLVWNILFEPVYHVGPDGWKKLSGDDVGELHYKYYPVMPSTVEQEMSEVAGAWEIIACVALRALLEDSLLDVSVCKAPSLETISLICAF